MSLELIERALEVEELVGEYEGQALVRAEALVPGAGREAVEALLAEAYLERGETEVQTDRVVLNATLNCQAVYRQGDEATLRALSAQANLSHVAEIRGAQSGMLSRVHMRVEHVEARYENGHMVFLASVGIVVSVSKLVNVSVIEDIAGVTGVESESVTMCSVRLAAESGASALITQEVALPAALDARMALMEWSSVIIEDVSAELGGVRVKGRINVETLISSGVPGRPVALIKYPLTFDQLVELPEWLAADARAEACVSKLMTRVAPAETGDDAALIIEAELDIAVRALGENCATALTDAYATTGNALVTQTRTLTLCTGVERVNCTDAFKGTLLLPENAPGAGTVLAVRVNPVLSGLDDENGVTYIEGLLEASVLYMPGGSDRLSSAQAELPFRVSCPGRLTQDSWLTVDAIAAEANALMSDRLELKCNLLINGETRIMQRYDILRAAELGEDIRKRPGIVLFWPEAGENIWAISKRYNVPVEEVKRMNGGVDTVEFGRALVLRI